MNCGYIPEACTLSLTSQGFDEGAALKLAPGQQGEPSKVLRNQRTAMHFNAALKLAYYRKVSGTCVFRMAAQS
jgi:hypothetical protein